MIPKIFHRVWIGEPNQEADSFWLKSKDIHPDWEHVTYSSKLPDGFNIISDVVKNNDTPSYHSDLIRLEALYRFGGFYVDTDVEVFKNFDVFCNQSKPIVGFENRENTAIGCAIMGSPPKNDEILKALIHIVETIKKDSVNGKIPYEQSQRYFLPNFLSKHWKNNENITKMNRDVFYPYDLGEKNEKRYFDFTSNPKTYAAHHWSLSWLKDGMSLVTPKNTKTYI